MNTVSTVSNSNFKLLKSCSYLAVLISLGAAFSGAAPAWADNKDLHRTLDMIDQHVYRERNRSRNFVDQKRRGSEVTAENEEARITADARLEKEYIFNHAPEVVYARSMRTPEREIFASEATQKAIEAVEARRLAEIKKARAAKEMKLDEASVYGNRRAEDLYETAANLKSQLTDAEINGRKGGFGLKAVGTNLYVRQYGAPEVARDVHHAAARVVPFGTLSGPGQ